MIKKYDHRYSFTATTALEFVQETHSEKILFDLYEQELRKLYLKGFDMNSTTSLHQQYTSQHESTLQDVIDLMLDRVTDVEDLIFFIGSEQCLPGYDITVDTNEYDDWVDVNCYALIPVTKEECIGMGVELLERMKDLEMSWDDVQKAYLKKNLTKK
jgi:hypothetical protein